MRMIKVLTALSFIVSVMAAVPFWTQISGKGEIPNPLWDGASSYDLTKNRWYTFGGLNGTFPSDFQIADFFVFDVVTSTWTNLTSAGPDARAESMMWVDPESNVFVSGGRGRFRSGLDLTKSDTFSFNPETLEWKLIPQTLEQHQIANRSTGAVVATNSHPYVFSGSRSTLSAFVNLPEALHLDVASFQEEGWKSITGGTEVPTPTPRAHHPIGYSAKLNSLFVYGGYTSDPNGGTFTEANYLGDLWRFDLENKSWKEYNFNIAQSPGKRDDMKLIIDDVNDRIWGYGGGDWTGAAFSDLWYFSLKTNNWSRVDTEMEPPFPSATIGEYHFYRRIENAYELFLFGGSLAEFGELTNQMWKLTIPF